MYVSNGDGLHHDNPVISGFCCEVDENCALMGYYTTSSGNFLPTFWDNPLVPSSRVNLNSKRKAVTLVQGLYMDGCGQQQVLSNVVPANRVDPGGRREGEVALMTTLPLSFPSTCINPIAWHHATENFLPPTFFHV